MCLSIEPVSSVVRFFFFFQAEDGIRDVAVTGVQTCALPIFHYGDASELVTRFQAGLPFPLTQAQRRVIAEIAADLSRPHPMNRLLQGDVGSEIGRASCRERV